MIIVVNLFKIAGVLLIVLAASGCNTVNGLGKDIEKGGEAIQKATK